MRAAEKRLVSSVALSHTLIHLFEGAYAGVLLFIKLEFGSGLFLLGLIANLFAFFFGAGALPAGFLADRIGSKRLLIVCLAGAALSSLLAAFSTSVYVLAIAMAALGITTGLYHPAGLSLISRETRMKGLAMGYHGVGGNLGIALAPLIAAVIASWLGWRASYLFLAIFALAPIAALHFSDMETGRGTAKKEENSIRVNWQDLKPTLVPLIFLYIGFMVTGFIYRGTLTFLPLYMSERVHFSFLKVNVATLGGGLASAALLLGVVGQYMAGFLAQKVRVERLTVVVVSIAVPALLIVGLTSGPVLVAVAALFAFFYFMNQPLFNLLIADYTPRPLHGRSFGISFFCSFGLGSFAAGFAGYIADNFGTNWIFIALSGVGGLLLALVFYLLWAANSRAANKTASRESFLSRT